MLADIASRACVPARQRHAQPESTPRNGPKSMVKVRRAPMLKISMVKRRSVFGRCLVMLANLGTTS